MTVNSIRSFFVITAAGALMGCAPETTTPMDGPPTYTLDVQPILQAKCTPCHSTEGMGMHNIASNYADVMKPVQSLDAQGCFYDVDQTMPKTVGECALISTMRGWMPFGSGCGAPVPPVPLLCVSDAEEAVIAAWVAAGMPQ